MRVLYLATSGSADPTRASIPIHLAVNGSQEAGQDSWIVLGGDATDVVQADTRDRVEGLGVPPLRELYAKVKQYEIPVYV